jgi:DNA helicase-2/ATP-dependent DNA helicase PcrA
MAANWESLNPEQNRRVDVAERARFVGGWNEHREIYGYTLLAELPFALRNALHNHPDLEAVGYDLLIVDEYQDLNACDLEVLRLIANRGCSIIGAGDDDQSIYSFRRAAPKGIRRFLDDYPGSGDYHLSVTQRCGSRIIDWATYVIEGDPGRPRNRPRLNSADGSPPGEVALLSFAGEGSEADGVTRIVQRLIDVEHVPASEILVLLRGDHHGIFSGPIKERLTRLNIPVSDPGIVERVLGEEANRKMLEILRLLVNRQDSLAWASLLKLTGGIGETFFEYVYERARENRIQFGQALLDSYAVDFPDGPARSSGRAHTLIESVLAWLEAHHLPDDAPEQGWGNWIVSVAGEGILPAPSEELATLLRKLDSVAEKEEEFGRYLGQISPLGKDITLAESLGVRIMTMGGSKGLTVQATIIAAIEDGIVPRPDCDLAEERRLLYVAMTRAKRFSFVTWARQRRGPTARAGAPRVAIRRRHSHFLDGGPVESEDGYAYIQRRWAGH